MIHYTYQLYLPGNPEAVFQFIDQMAKDYPLEKLKFFLWVDNNDHKTSSEFYKLRKYIKKGANIEVFVNPPLPSRVEVIDWLEARATEQGYVNHDN